MNTNKQYKKKKQERKKRKKEKNTAEYCNKL